jgi:hypothetical protein
MIICAFENSPSIPSFLMIKIVYIGYGQLKKMTPFPFTFAADARQGVIIICRCPQNIIEISLSRKNVHRSMLSKMSEM